MPSTPIYPPAEGSANGATASASGLPQLLQTPSGLAILEIQGTINTSLPTTTDSTTVGKLVFPGYDASRGEEDTSWHKRVYLYVGKHQRLTGEVKRLAKPLAILKRRRVDEGAGGALEVAEIVRWKVLFAHRPEPVGAEQGGVEL